MVEFGGGFVSKLGAAALVADAGNMKKLRDAFPDYWANYARMALQISEVEKQASAKHNNNTQT